MEKEAFETVKLSKPFKLGDLFIYGGVILIILAIFLAVLLPKKNQTNGFIVYNGDSVVLTYEYDSDKLSIKDEFADSVVVATNGNITVYLDENKTEFNTFAIDKKEKSVKIVDANCSVKKDCVHTPAMSNDGAIICMPHQLKIVPLGDGFIPPVTG